MSTAAIIIIIAAVVVLAIVLVLGNRAARERKLQARREHAGELRETAQEHSLRAERQQVAADQQAARAQKAQAEAEESAAIARRESLEARERAQVAEREGALARDHHDRATEVDPDVDVDDTDGVADSNGRRADAEEAHRTA